MVFPCDRGIVRRTGIPQYYGSGPRRMHTTSKTSRSSFDKKAQFRTSSISEITMYSGMEWNIECGGFHCLIF